MNDLLEGTTAEWVQPKAMANYYELRADDILLATLTFRSAFGTLATAEAAGGRWTFKRVGFLNPHVTVRVEGADEDLAVYDPRFWGDGTVTFRNGPSYTWKPANFWSTEWVFRDMEGNLVMQFKSGIKERKLTDLIKIQFSLHVVPSPANREVTTVLVALGMYLLILHHRDTVAATSAAT